MRIFSVSQLEFFIKPIFNIFRTIAKKAGYNIQICKYVVSGNKSTNLVNLNIGAGTYEIDNFLSLDIYTDHYYKNKEDFLRKRIEYNIRKDKIPFNESTVDNIYISHVIEHIEDEFVFSFFAESYRVLKKGGVLRVACPDADFLYQVSQFRNDYWNWRIESLNNKKRYQTNWEIITQYDYLLRELSTPKMRFYKNKIPDQIKELSYLKNMSYKEFCAEVKKDLIFRKEHPGDHINNWDFERLKSIAEYFKFEHIIKSKPQGSVSSAMSTPDFDRTKPSMSLYVEMIK